MTFGDHTIATKSSHTLFLVLSLLLAGATSGCQHAPHDTTRPAATMAAANADLRDQLAELLKAHDDKMQLCWYVSMPLHQVDPAIKAFFTQLYTDQKRLRTKLEAWARTNHYDLHFKYGMDIAGRARNAMEDAQGRQLQQDTSAEFGHDVLTMMALDFATQETLAAELLKIAPDAALRAYLQESIQTHQAEERAARTLLKRYKFQ